MSRTQDVFNGRSREEWEYLIRQWIHSERDRYIITRRYLDGITLEKIAEEINISVNYCQERSDKAKSQLFEHVEPIKNA